MCETAVYECEAEDVSPQKLHDGSELDFMEEWGLTRPRTSRKNYICKGMEI